MADLSNTNGYVKLKAFVDMANRVDAWFKANGSNPNKVYTDDKRVDFVQMSTFDNMRARYRNWVNNTGTEPGIVYFKAQASGQDGVYVEPTWKDYDQTTDYTCGPTSSAMALSALGIDTSESEMANREYTTEDGTGHDGIINGCIAEAKEHGISLTVKEQNFSAGGNTLAERFKTLGELIADPNVAVIANGMCSGWPTYYKSYKGGHYVFPVKVDMNTSKVYIADPARSWTLEYSFQEFANGLAAHSLPSLLILRKS